MTIKVKPLPNEPVSNSFVWREWLYNLGQAIDSSLTIDWNNLDFTGSDITDIKNRPHNSLQGLQGGDASGTQYYHLSNAQYTQVTNFFNYGQWYSTANQTFTAATATQITLDTQASAFGMSLASNTITVATAGTYNITYSLQLANTDTAIRYATFWFKQNGTDVVGSGSKFNIPNSHGGLDGYTVAVSNVVLTCNAGDTIQLWGAVEATNVYIEYYAAQTTPYIMPSIPGSIVTVQQVA